MSRNQRTDSRYKTRRWKKLRLQILRRDLWVCQIRGKYCRDTANQVDHILSPHPDLDGADFWDPANLRAACAPCNNGRNAPAERKRSLGERRTVDSPPANLSLQSRFGPVRSDYSRRPLSNGDRSR